MSFWATAIVAAKSAVITPTQAMRVGSQSADTASSGLMRTIRYTPAVTIVAAWIRAETGVGPSIASGSHVWSGSWADLAKAPTSSRRHAAITRPTSPITLITNALMPAFVAVSRRYQ